MAVTGISHKEAVERQNRMEAWSGVISWTLYGLLAILVAAVILVLVEGQRKENRTTELRAAWNLYYQAFKDQETAQKEPENAERIPILEGLWEKTKGTPVQPFVALELAQAHYNEALAAGQDSGSGNRSGAEEDLQKQHASLKKALAVFNVVRTNWPDHLTYGPLACEGAALCSEQLKDYSGAISVLEEAVKKYSKQFLSDKMRYDLARNYWLRAQEKEAGGGSATEDREKALENISRAVSEVATPEEKQREWQLMSWKIQARYLRSLLKPQGDALSIFPEGKPPVRAEPEKGPDATNEKPKATDEKPKATDEKPAPDKKPETTEKEK